MNKIAITTTSFAKYDDFPLKLCKEKGFEITTNPYKRKIELGELVELAKDAVGIIAGTEVIAKDTLSQLPHVKVISRCGTGMENIDIETANKMGIKVFNTPDAPTLAVAELTVGLILNLLRKLNRMDSDIRGGKWDKKMGNLLSGKKVGIVGFGRIGKKVIELLKSFGCEIAYTDPAVEDMPNRMSFKELLGWADIVSLHISGADKIIKDKELALMKKGAWLVNASRGGVVDEEALYRVLKSGYLSGAAIDVFEKEPYDGPLKKLDNVILTPHIGSYAKEARVKMEIEAVRNLLKGLKIALSSRQGWTPRNDISKYD